MHHHRSELLSVGIGEVVGVVDAASAVMIRIHEDDDMLVGRACQYVVQFLQMEGRQVTVAIERVEMRAEDGVLPDAFRGFAGAALF